MNEPQKGIFKKETKWIKLKAIPNLLPSQQSNFDKIPNIPNIGQKACLPILALLNATYCLAREIKNNFGMLRLIGGSYWANKFSYWTTCTIHCMMDKSNSCEEAYCGWVRLMPLGTCTLQLTFCDKRERA